MKTEISKSENAKDLLSTKQLATLWGVHYKTLIKAIIDKRLTPKKRQGNGFMFDPDEARKEFDAKTSPQNRAPSGTNEAALRQFGGLAESPSSESDAGGYNANRTRREAVMLRISEIELAQKRGKLVDRDVVERAAADAATATKNAILNVPNRIADQLASMTDSTEIYNLLLKELNLALKEMADEQRRTLNLPEQVV